MKSFLFLLFLLAACVSQTTSTETATDSLAVATDTVAANTTVASQPEMTTDGRPVAMTVDINLPDSLKNQPLAVYHGYYRLSSSSSAEQARMTISFEGNRTFSYTLNYGVADFCSADTSGSFTVDESNTGNDPAQRKVDENGNPVGDGQLVFTLGDGKISISDGIHEFGVGVCNYSGDFFRCDGPCPEIKSEDYGVEETESDSVR